VIIALALASEHGPVGASDHNLVERIRYVDGRRRWHRATAISAALNTATRRVGPWWLPAVGVVRRRAISRRRYGRTTALSLRDCAHRANLVRQV